MTLYKHSYVDRKSQIAKVSVRRLWNVMALSCVCLVRFHRLRQCRRIAVGPFLVISSSSSSRSSRTAVNAQNPKHLAAFNGANGHWTFDSPTTEAAYEDIAAVIVWPWSDVGPAGYCSRRHDDMVSSYRLRRVQRDFDDRIGLSTYRQYCTRMQRRRRIETGSGERCPRTRRELENRRRDNSRCNKRVTTTTSGARDRVGDKRRVVVR